MWKNLWFGVLFYKNFKEKGGCNILNRALL